MIREKYHTEDINKKTGNIVAEEKIINDLNEESDLIEVKKESIFKRIIEFIIFTFKDRF